MPAWAVLSAAVVYVANPYVVVAGGTLAVLWPYALLPWLVSFLVRAVTDGHGWRWPAAAALVFAGMTGMNAGVVPIMQLVVVPPFVVLAKHRAGCSWGRVAGAMARWAVLALLLSAYWLVPTLGALGAGQTVVDNSESLAGIAVVSSWAEVLRGLGLWPLYGGDLAGPWIPEQVAYLTTVVVVALTFCWTVLVGASLYLSRGALRLAALAALVITATVMVGLYPGPQRHRSQLCCDGASTTSRALARSVRPTRPAQVSSWQLPWSPRPRPSSCSRAPVTHGGSG